MEGNKSIAENNRIMDGYIRRKMIRELATNYKL
jgi:hypothetical protein